MLIIRSTELNDRLHDLYKIIKITVSGCQGQPWVQRIFYWSVLLSLFDKFCAVNKLDKMHIIIINRQNNTGVFFLMFRWDKRQFNRDFRYF